MFVIYEIRVQVYHKGRQHAPEFHYWSLQRLRAFITTKQHGDLCSSAYTIVTEKEVSSHLHPLSRIQLALLGVQNMRYGLLRSFTWNFWKQLTLLRYSRLPVGAVATKGTLVIGASGL